MAVADRLNLNTSLRSHLASELHGWIRSLLDGDRDSAVRLAEQVRADGFDAYVTRDLEVARAYVTERYAGELDKRFGLLASSRAKAPRDYGIDNDFQATRRLKVGPWYNAEPADPQSCCQLRQVATEFACQGLELDLPIVAWGEDLLWQQSRWVSPPQPRSQAKDPHRLRTNSYRVLLTRGRDGMVLFVPNEPRFHATAQALEDFGFQPLT